MKKAKKIFFSVIVLIALHAYFHRNLVITQYMWKQTSGGELSNGILSFEGGGNRTYCWPFIKEREKYIGIVLLYVSTGSNIWDRMIVFSLENPSFALFCKI